MRLVEDGHRGRDDLVDLGKRGGEVLLVAQDVHGQHLAGAVVGGGPTQAPQGVYVDGEVHPLLVEHLSELGDDVGVVGLDGRAQGVVVAGQDHAGVLQLDYPGTVIGRRSGGEDQRPVSQAA